MMKKRFLPIVCISVWGGAMLTSCQEEDALQQPFSEQIQFNGPSVSVDFAGSTREMINNQLPVNSKFGVVGYCVPKQLNSTDMDWASGSAAWDAKKGNAVADVFFNTKVTVEGDGTCNYGTHKNWYDRSNNTNVVNGNSYQYTFFAWYPYKENTSESKGWTLNNPVNATTPGVVKLTYTMPFSGTDEAVMRDYNLVDDCMLAVKLNHLRGQGNVNFTFHHIMTGLRVKVINYSPYQDITIHSVRLKGSSFIRKVEVDMNQIGSTENLYSYSETFAGTFTFSNTKRVLKKNGGEADMENTILLLKDPTQKFPLGKNIQIEVNYSYNGVTKQQVTELPLSFKPSSGRVYAFTLAFAGDIFMVDVDSENTDQWEPGNGSDKDIIFD